MGKNIVVEERQNQYQTYENISKILIPNADGTESFWVPEDSTPPGQDLPLTTKTITENGTYNAYNDRASGYSMVTVDVDQENIYSASDNNKVVVGGELVSQTTKNISFNGTHDTTLNNQVIVNVGNSFGAGDEGKVVQNGNLVSQTNRVINGNNTYDTTTNNQITVSVANSYTQSDEGKVVSSSQLVEQSSRSITENGTYNTTTNNEVVVNVSQGGGSATLITKSINQNGSYNASSDGADGYNSVTVNVPNSYTSEDEGKVVSSGALASQTSKTITSNGTYSTVLNNQVIVTVENEMEVDSVPTQGSSNPVSSGGVYDALSLKQNLLTFDSSPVQNSSNPVTSGGMYSIIAALVQRIEVLESYHSQASGVNASVQNNILSLTGDTSVSNGNLEIIDSNVGVQNNILEF